MSNQRFFRATTLLLALTLAAFAGTAFAAPDDRSFRATVDLTGAEIPVLSLSNPNDHPVVIQAVATSTATGQLRSYRIRLEPLGSSTLSLESAEGFTDLTMASRDNFSAHLQSAADQPAREIAVSDRQLLGKAGDTCPAVLGECWGDWTLTCTNCGFDPITKVGWVRQTGRVHWGENRPCDPHVSWETCTSQGLEATWTPSYGCPDSVTNSLGHNYTVSIDFYEECEELP